MSNTDRPTRPEPITISLNGITRDPVTFYRLREADAYMDELEAEARELDHQNSVLMMDLESCEEGGGESNRQLRNRITELKGALRMTQTAMDRWYAEKRFPEGMPLLRQLVSNTLSGEQTTGGSIGGQNEE